MVATHASTPSLRFSISVASRVPMPHTKPASLISTLSSTMLRYTGWSDAPSSTTASQPASLIFAPIMPPQWASTTRWSFVNVDSEQMVVRPARGTPEAVSGPTAKMSLFSGEKGSVPAGTSSYMILLAKPMPPMYSL